MVWNFFTFEAKRYAWWGRPCWSAWVRCGGLRRRRPLLLLRLSTGQCGGLNAPVLARHALLLNGALASSHAARKLTGLPRALLPAQRLPTRPRGRSRLLNRVWGNDLFMRYMQTGQYDWNPLPWCVLGQGAGAWSWRRAGAATSEQPPLVSPPPSSYNCPVPCPPPPSALCPVLAGSAPGYRTARREAPPAATSWASTTTRGA